MQLYETDVQAAHGLQTPYSASQVAYSTLSESHLLTHRCYPGLSGIVKSSKGQAPVIFVDKLPDSEMFYARLIPVERLNHDATAQPVVEAGWLVHVQHHFEAWHFLAQQVDASAIADCPLVIFIEWKPGALQAALTEHDELFIHSDLGAEDLLIGSDFEKESLSRYYLSAGLSSLANVHLASGVIESILKAPLKKLGLTSKSAVRACAYPLVWTTRDD
jgi:hypothetical protein